MKITSRILRRMGYSADSQGIMNRYINVQGAWDAHLSNTRNFILKTVKAKSIENLAVLGSGWLLDLPVEELSSSVKHLWLFDIVHPSQVIHKLKKYGNVTFKTVDITGGVLSAAYEAAYAYKQTGIIPGIEPMCNRKFQWPKVFDYTISLNILSQVGELVTNYLSERIPYTEAEISKISSLLQQSHLNLLTPGKACLITDIKEKGLDADDHPVFSRNLIHCAFSVPANAASWSWLFDPLKEYNAGLKTISDVVAFEL
jgi:hypothetical protein